MSKGPIPHENGNLHEKDSMRKISTGKTPRDMGKTPWENQIPEQMMETTERMLSFSSREKVTACGEETHPSPQNPKPRNPLPRESGE